MALKSKCGAIHEALVPADLGSLYAVAQRNWYHSTSKLQRQAVAFKQPFCPGPLPTGLAFDHDTSL